MKTIPGLSLVVALPLFAAPPAESPYTVPQSPFYGQVRLRTEYDSKDVRDTLSNHPYLNSQLRSRLGFVAAPSPKVEIKIEVQDVRFLGSEPVPVATNPATASTGNRMGVDLLQGYFAVEEGPFKTVFGRQKMSLGAGRVLSTLEWSPTSRAFDGWSFNLNLDPGNLTGLLFLIKDTNSATTVPSVKDHLLLSGLHYSHQITPDIVAEAYSFYDQSTLPATYGGFASVNYDLYYLGERVAGKIGMLAFEEEFVWQGGELTATVAPAAKTSAAFQLAARVGAVIGTHRINFGLDMMSGDDDATDDEVKTYRANYYFAHNLYGWMDYFVNNPRFGVIDYRVDGDFAFLPNAAGNPMVTLKPQYHYFTPQSAPPASDDPYGQEFNLEAHLGLYPKSNIVLGTGYFLPGDAAANLPAAKITNAAYSNQAGWFLYFMPVFNF